MKKGFTLIEILTILVGITVISGLLITLIKPGELFKCVRDSQRINDLQALSSAIQYYIISVDNPDLDGPYQNRGVYEPSSTIFISAPSDKESIPNTFVVGTSTYIINAVNSKNSKNIDGSGWLPINFSSLKLQTINTLPVDPINSYNSKYFYSYVFHRGMKGFELNANLECNRYKKGGVEDKTSTEGGDDPDIYEVGSILTLLPSELYLSQRITGLKPTIALSDRIITIDTVINNISSTKVYIYNLGSTTLAVYNITQQPPQARISTDKDYIIIPPNSFEPLSIICNAKDLYTTTTFSTALKLWNNDYTNNPYDINVTCNVVTAPRISIVPHELNIITTTGASSSAIFKITNKGSSDLNITNINLYREESTSTCANFVSFNLSSSIIPPNQSVTLTTIVDATNLNSKQNFYCKYYIESNDPLRSLQVKKVNIKVKSLPGEVSNLIVKKAGSQQLQLIWTEPDNGYDNIISYKIYRKINATPTQADFATSVKANILTFLDTGLTNGTNYCYRISAVNNVGEGPLSSVACEIPTGTPSPPILNTTAGNKTVALSWSVSNNGGSIITGYDIYWKTSNQTSWSLLKRDYQNTSFTHIVPSVSSCINYQYYVIAKNSEGLSAPSNIASATPYGTSSAPKNASSTAGVNYVTLGWQTPDDLGCPTLNYYNIYKATSSLNFVFIASTTNLTFTDYNVASNTTYYYYITAVNNYGESDKSNITSATPGLPKCSAPTNLTLTPGDRSIELMWNTSLSAGYYYLYYSSNTPSNFVKFATVTHPTNTYTHSGLINGQTYYYYVTAENPGVCLESNPSNIASSSPGTVPSPPRNFKANSYQDRIELRWEEPESNGGYPILYYSLYKGTGVLSFIATTSASTLSYIDTNVNPYDLYTYAISATNKIGEGSKSYLNAGYCPSWSIIYGGANDDKPAYTYLLNNGKYVIVGETTLNSDKGGLGGIDGFLMRIDSLGNLELLNTYGSSADESVRSFVILDDGNYLIVGTTKSYGDSGGDIFLAKISSSTGAVIWSKIYGTAGIDDYPFIARGNTPLDNYIYLTFSTQYQTFGGRDIVVMKLDQYGNIIWQKRLGGPGDDIPYKIAFNSDYLYIVGYTQSYGAGNWDGLLINLKTNGNLVYAKTYGGNNAEYLFDIMLVPYYGIHLFGRTLSLGAGNNDYIEVYPLDSPDLETPYAYTFGTPNQDYGFSYTFLDGTAGLLGGTTNSLGAGGEDLLLIKTHNWPKSEIITGGVMTLGGSLSDRLPVFPILTNTVPGWLDSNKILITARTNSSGFGGNDIWLIKLNSLFEVKNSLNQTGFEPGSGFQFSVQPTTSIVRKNISGQIIVTKINNLGQTTFVSKNQSITLQTRSAVFNKLYVAKCPNISVTSTPSEPLNLRVINQNTYNQISWGPPLSDGGSPILYYKLYKWSQEWPAYNFLASTTNLNFNDYSILQNKNYCYKVSAVNSIGEGPLSAEACTFSSTGSSVPGTSTLTVTPGNKQNRLDWTQPNDGGSPILEYRVYQYINGNYNLIAITASSVRTYTHQNLNNGVEYCYAVSARNAVGEGNKSNIACGVPRGAPSAPRNLQATVEDRVISLSWQEPIDNGGAPILEYRIYRRLSGSSYNFNSPLASTSPSSLSYNDTNVIPGTTYCYVVKAKNNYGESEQSNEVCKKAGTKPAQWAIGVLNYGKDWVQLQFNCINAPEDSYCTGGYPITKIKIYRGTSPTTLFLYQELLNPASQNYSFTDTGLSTGVTYYYAITVVNEINLEGPTSSVVSVTPQEDQIRGEFKYLIGSVHNVGGRDYVGLAFGIKFDAPQYIDNIKIYWSHAPVDYPQLDYLCDRELRTIIYNPPPAGTLGTTTISLKKSCKALIIPLHPLLSWMSGLVLDANDILSINGTITIGNVSLGPWISVRFDGRSVYLLHSILIPRPEIMAEVKNIALYK